MKKEICRTVSKDLAEAYKKALAAPVAQDFEALHAFFKTPDGPEKDALFKRLAEACGHSNGMLDIINAWEERYRDPYNVCTHPELVLFRYSPQAAHAVGMIRCAKYFGLRSLIIADTWSGWTDYLMTIQNNGGRIDKMVCVNRGESVVNGLRIVLDGEGWMY